MRVLAAAALLVRSSAHRAGPVADPWDVLDGWRVTGPAPRRTNGEVAGQVVEVAGTVRRYRQARDPARPGPGLAGSAAGPGARERRHRRPLRLGPRRGAVWLGHDGDTWAFTPARTIDRTGPARAATGRLASPMPGTVLAVHVRSRRRRSGPGSRSWSVEAMKMEHVVTRPSDGTVAEVLVRAGDSVRLDQPLAVVDPGGRQQP